jgi:pyruvate,water dikinase
VREELNFVRLFIFDHLLASTIAYVRLREESSFLISQDSFELRRVFLALADKLVDQGCLKQRDDIFYLEIDEIRRLVHGQLEAVTAQEWVEARRREMERGARIELPDTIYGEFVPVAPVSLAPGKEYLSGIVGSSGVAEGRARVVLDPMEAPSSLRREDILVVPFTDVSWTPLFTHVGGVVADTGGQLSHSAIVARECGLPAVVNVKNATLLIEEGRSIVVDGNEGRVYLT